MHNPDNSFPEFDNVDCIRSTEDYDGSCKCAECRELFGKRNWTLSPRKIAANIDYGSVGAGKTELMIGTAIHQAVENTLLRQQVTRKRVAQAAFKLGRISVRMLHPEQRKAAEQEIKNDLAQQLVNCGVSYDECADIVRDMVEGLKNV